MLLVLITLLPIVAAYNSTRRSGSGAPLGRSSPADAGAAGGGGTDGPRRLPVTSPFTLDAFGRTWYVKDSGGAPWDPGPCVFRAGNVVVDSDGLHLYINPTDTSCGSWTSAEVWDSQSQGYGTYLIRATGPFTYIDPQVTLGLFLWDDDAGLDTSCEAPPCNYREFDIEVGRWGDLTDANNAQFVRQPASTAGNLLRVDLSSASQLGGANGNLGAGPCHDPGPDGFNGGVYNQVTFVLQWFGGPPRALLRWWALDGFTTLATLTTAPLPTTLASLDFSDTVHIPTPGDARVHLNLWQANWGGAPGYGRVVHVAISGVEFTPNWIDLPAAGYPLQGGFRRAAEVDEAVLPPGLRGGRHAAAADDVSGAGVDVSADNAASASPSPSSLAEAVPSATVAASAPSSAEGGPSKLLAAGLAVVLSFISVLATVGLARCWRAFKTSAPPAVAPSEGKGLSGKTSDDESDDGNDSNYCNDDSDSKSEPFSPQVDALVAAPSAINIAAAESPSALLLPPPADQQSQQQLLPPLPLPPQAADASAGDVPSGDDSPFSQPTRRFEHIPGRPLLVVPPQEEGEDDTTGAGAGASASMGLPEKGHGGSAADVAAGLMSEVAAPEAEPEVLPPACGAAVGEWPSDITMTSEAARSSEEPGPPPRKSSLEFAEEPGLPRNGSHAFETGPEAQN